MRTRGFASVLALLSLLVLAAVNAPGAAASVGPRFDIEALSDTTAAPGGTLDYFVTVEDVGDAQTDGSRVELKVSLPAGLTVASATNLQTGSWDCSTLQPGASSATCTFEGLASPYDASLASLELTVDVGAGASGTLTSSFTVSGGGAPPASTVDPTLITSTAPGFGIDSFDAQIAADPAGDPYTQAGGHPYALTTSILFNTITNPTPALGETSPVEQPKDISVDLPPGLVADPTATGEAKCTQAQLAFGGTPSETLCPPGSQVGEASVFTTNGFVFGPPVPVYDLLAPPGVPARFGFNVGGSVVMLDGGVHTSAGGTVYSLTADVRNVQDGLAIAGTRLTLWGTPADPSHDLQRSCPNKPPIWNRGGPACTSEAPSRPFLRNPTSCTPPGQGLTTTLSADSWTHPGTFVTATSTTHALPAFPAAPADWGPVVGTSGCDQVPFAPAIAVTPDLAAAGAPSGFSFDVTLPQSEDPTAIATSDLKKAVVTLPAGVRLSASSSGGLQGCPPAAIALGSDEEPSCPEASKLGTVTIDTPLLSEPLSGSIYLATPHENPSGSLVALYLVARGPGIVLKIPGAVTPNPATGQITTTFENNPQLPFTRLHLAFKAGPRAPLSLPRACGTYVTHATFTGWSGAVATSESSFAVSRDGFGAPCPPPAFGPSLTAGTTDALAGAFAPLTLELQRSDQDGEIESLSSLTLPPGLLADTAAVPVRCSDAQASEHACPAASHIGTVSVGVGAGPDPYYVPGDVYLMGPFSSGRFAGDPFGLAVVIHALAGPFDLGYVVVKGGIHVNDDGSITTQTEPFPRILQGIPVQTRDVRLTLDRPGFTLNPTDCNPLAVTGLVRSTEGQSAGVSSRFQAAECAKLAFKPAFSAATQANGRQNRYGTSLTVKIASHQGPANATREANIAKVEVQLPAAMPSRLTTLQKACTAAQFEANPAGCPAESRVGTAAATTPILKSKLEGPAYLVSHGGAAFPDLVLVLQGEGITLDVVGHTHIKKNAQGKEVTYSKFETVPDAPISSFELKLPEGRYSVLAIIEPPCGHTVKKHGRTRHVAANLTMPTTITAQDGAVIRQTTKVKVAGCPRASASRARGGR